MRPTSFPTFHERLSLAVALASLGCAAGTTGAGTPASPTVWARSHNASEVEVYTACGFEDVRWVGAVPAKSAAEFELEEEESFCPSGRRFFLVVRDQGRGYWAGPLRPTNTSAIELVIEKYAGLSVARTLE